MKVLSIITSFLMLVSCNQKSSEDKIREVMGSDYLRPIKFHEKMVAVKNGRDVNRNYYIIHYFSADCDKCIYRLKEIKKFMDDNKDLPIDYKLIFTAPTDYYVNQALKSVKIEYPFFRDKEFWGFQIINKIPVGDQKYETMLLNKDDELILYGHFFDNPKAYGLLKDFLNEKI